MFIDNRLSAYYYRPSMIAADRAQQIAGTPSLGALGQTGPSGLTVKDFLPRDWFDSSVYRNILDMINSVKVTRDRLWGGALGQMIGVRVLPARRNGRPRQAQCMQRAGLYGPFPDRQSPEYRAFWGWTQTQTPGDKSSGPIAKYIYTKIFKASGAPVEYVGQSPQIQEILRKANYQPFPGSAEYGWYCPLARASQGYRQRADQIDNVNRHNKIIRNGWGYSSQDIVQLVRSLDWEMNRVHLPLPFNLRQWATRYNELSMDSGGISYAERIKQLEDLDKWIIIMQEKIRQAIDASNLARKVAEESLRKEDARILKETQEERAAREAERLRQIEQERVAAKELIEAEKRRIAEEAARQKARIEKRSRQIEEAQARVQPLVEASRGKVPEGYYIDPKGCVRTVPGLKLPVLPGYRIIGLTGCMRPIAPQEPVTVPPPKVTPAPVVVPKIPVPAPIPVPAEPFKPPALVTTPPVVAPEVLPPTAPIAPQQNLLPLIAAGVAALFFMG